MGREQFIMMKLKDSWYSNQLLQIDDDIVYCEIEYQRDRSSFAGMAFKITDMGNDIVVRKSEEKIIKDVSKYEKIYMGCEQDYIDSIQATFSSEKKEYGIDIFFLIYSDIRSSQIIFEKLIEAVDKNVEAINGL